MPLLKRIFDHLYQLDVGFPELANTFTAYFLIGDRIAIVDPGPARYYKNVIEGLNELGFKKDDVEYILATHIHLDHIGSVGYLVEEFKNAKIIVHPKGAKHLIDPTKLYEASKKVLGDEIMEIIGEPKPVPEDRIESAKDYMIYELGNDICFLALYTPGHASHHVAYFTDANDILFVGDAAGEFINGYLIPSAPPPFRFDLAVQSLRKMMVLRPLYIAYAHFGVHNSAFDRLTEYYGKLYYWMDLFEEFLSKNMTEEEVFDFVLRYDHRSREFNTMVKVNPFLRDALKHSLEGFYQYIQWKKEKLNS